MLHSKLVSTTDVDTPYIVWSGEHVDYWRLKIFGCKTYNYAKDNKFHTRAKKAIFLEFTKDGKGYRL